MVALGTDPLRHDVRFVEDDWESPTLGAWGLGWQVWLDGLEVSQFTYFQQCGGFDCKPVSGELTYGLERIVMYLQDVDTIYDAMWAPGVRYGEITKRAEWEWSTYNFTAASVEYHRTMFDTAFRECQRLLGLEERVVASKKGSRTEVVYGSPPLARLVLPAYDFCVKASHHFNVLDARGAISVTARQDYIKRVRALAHRCAESWLAQREALGHPLLLADPKARPAVAE
jgi:glycyl-tRNA synthetase alpha chain